MTTVKSRKSTRLSKYDAKVRKAQRSEMPVLVRSVAVSHRDRLAKQRGHINAGNSKTFAGMRAMVRTSDGKAHLFIGRPEIIEMAQRHPMYGKAGRPQVIKAPVQEPKRSLFSRIFGL